MAAVLRFFAEGSYQHGVGKDVEISMAQSTFSEVLTAVLNVMEKKLCPEWIVFEMTDAEKSEAKRYFFKRNGFPGVIGCIDGTHVNIILPKACEHLYYNRKGSHSINAMMVKVYNKFHMPIFFLIDNVLVDL